MKNHYLLTTCCVAWLFSCVNAHIHSHKVHVEKERLTASTWICALLSSAMVGACGVFPLFVNRWIKLDSACKDNLAFRCVLCFAVGGLLGDVFLHLLPEAWSSPNNHKEYIGLWVMSGLLTFLIIEKIVKHTEIPTDDTTNVDSATDVTAVKLNSNSSNGTNGSIRARAVHTEPRQQKLGVHKLSNGFHSEQECGSKLSHFFEKDISGYLNLVANCTDNFTHGLAIAASYVASPMVGLLTTLAILCHEIPHEIGDFAILINSGFTLKEAAKAQIATATGGLFGVVAGLTAEYLSSVSSWLLPFTAGGFLYIALVSILPDIISVKSYKQLLLELLSLGLGIVIMAMVTIVEKKSCNYVPTHYL